MFFGIIIKMNKDRPTKQHKPHLHAMHAGEMTSFDIETGDVLAGSIDKDDVDKVRGWISIHREELFANWKMLREDDAFFKIDPLR